MNREKLFEAIGDIDPGLVAEAQSAPDAKTGLTWRQRTLAAACVALLVFAGAAAAVVRLYPERMPWNKRPLDDITDGVHDALPALCWEQDGKGRPSSLLPGIIEFDGAYYELANMSDGQTLAVLGLPGEIREDMRLDRVGSVSADSRELTLYEYRPDQSAIYIAEWEGKYTFAVFCNRIHTDPAQYESAQEIFEIYGIHGAQDIYRVEIGDRSLTAPEEIREFYGSLCSAQGMGNAAWNERVFGGLSEERSARLSLELADTVREITVVSYQGIKVSGVRFYPTINCVEWAINYYFLG